MEDDEDESEAVSMVSISEEQREGPIDEGHIHNATMSHDARLVRDGLGCVKCQHLSSSRSLTHVMYVSVLFVVFR